MVPRNDQVMVLGLVQLAKLEPFESRAMRSGHSASPCLDGLGPECGRCWGRFRPIPTLMKLVYSAVRERESPARGKGGQHSSLVESTRQNVHRRNGGTQGELVIRPRGALGTLLTSVAAWPLFFFPKSLQRSKSVRESAAGWMFPFFLDEHEGTCQPRVLIGQSS